MSARRRDGSPQGENEHVSFGTELRRERDNRGVELRAIAEATKVSERYLRALEADNHAELPGGIFNKGMVRGYCRQLGLDENEWLGRFAATFETEGGEPDWSAFADNVKAARPKMGRTGMRWWGVALMVVVVAAMAWGAWHYVVKRKLGLPRVERQALAVSPGAKSGGPGAAG